MSDLASRAPRPAISTLLSSYGLLILGVALALTFSIVMPDTFPTALTVRAILNDQTTVLLLALGLTVVVTTGEFDMSVGYGLGLTYVLTVGLIVNEGMAWPMAALLAIGVGAALGTFNGVLVHVVKIDSFIATLGTGTICYGLSAWYTGGQQILGLMPVGFTELASQSLLGIPQPALVAVVVALVLWIMLEYTPVGRYLYTLGFNRKAAELSGISARRYGIAAFVISGVVIGITGVLLASRLQIGNSTTGPEYLLPAFVGSLLGKTTIRPGRPNVIGTVLAVVVLAVGIAGLQQLGGKFYVENLFNGFTLIIAVGVAGYVARRRTSEKPTLPPGDPTSPSNAEPNADHPDVDTHDVRSPEAHLTRGSPTPDPFDRTPDAV